MKKLKGLGRRAYNVLFHTHTVAGIVISFALFVIFYAGAFALFRHETQQWENPDMRQALVTDLNYDQALSRIDSAYQLDFHQVTNINFPTEFNPVISVFGAYHETDTTTARMAAYISPQDGQIRDRFEPLTTVANTIYHLHYFRQIPVVGLYLSGFVALFFLFATVSGVLIHWQNILTKFYAFVKEGKWKTIWTNAHTVLGVIGLPFQVMYAVTGAFFGLLVLVLLPSVFFLYGGDQGKVFAKVQPQQTIVVAEDAPAAVGHLSLNEMAEQIKTDYPDHFIQRVQLRNYGREDAVATWQIDSEQAITSSGVLSMRMQDGALLNEFSVLPDTKKYANKVTDFIFKLHFATFGGPLVRVLYFVLSMLTCFMIITGVLIWRTARDNKRYTYEQRLFHHRVTKWYLAICLSMFPTFAILFLANKMIPIELDGRTTLVNSIFFTGWLLLTILGLFWNNYSQQNRNYFFLGGCLALLVPVANGVVTGAWFWKSWTTYAWVAYLDLFWLFTGLIALYLSVFVLRVKPESDRPVRLVGTKKTTVVTERPATVVAVVRKPE